MEGSRSVFGVSRASRRSLTSSPSVGDNPPERKLGALHKSLTDGEAVMKNKLPKNSDRHHLFARSRGGHIPGNVVIIPRRVHSLYHALFGNMTPAEAKRFIDVVFVTDTTWSERELEEAMLRIMEETCVITARSSREKVY